MAHLLAALCSNQSEQRPAAFLAIGDVALACSSTVRQARGLPGALLPQPRERVCSTLAAPPSLLHSPQYSPSGGAPTASLADLQLASALLASTPHAAGSGGGGEGLAMGSSPSLTDWAAGASTCVVRPAWFVDLRGSICMVRDRRGSSVVSNSGAAWREHGRSMAMSTGRVGGSPTAIVECATAISAWARAESSNPLTPLLPAILKEVRDNLGGRKGRSAKGGCVEALVCLAKLAEALGPELGSFCDELIPFLFSCPLSPALVHALQSMADHIPSLLPALQARLLDLLTTTLAPKQSSFSEWLHLSVQEQVASSTHALTAAAQAEPERSASPTEHMQGTNIGDVSTLALALTTLGSFGGGEWRGMEAQVLEFAHRCASIFLDAEQVEVRRAAAMACCSLLVAHVAEDEETEAELTPAVIAAASPPRTAVAGSRARVRATTATRAAPGVLETVRRLASQSVERRGSVEDSATNSAPRSPAAAAAERAAERAPPTPGATGAMSRRQQERTCAAVLQKVLMCGVVDPEGAVRRLVFAYLLSGDLDKHLAQQEALRCLCMATHDEQPIIKQAAVAILGRLCHLNPAHGLPALRTRLLQLTTDIQYSSCSEEREEAARLLGAMFANAAHLLRPYTASIFAAMLPRVADRSAAVSAAVLRALGHLAAVSGQAVLAFAPRMLPQIIEALRDPASVARRHAALAALSQLLRTTGNVTEPYLHYPDLLPTLLGMLTSERGADLRNELLRALGTLGALDPSTQARMALQRQRAVTLATAKPLQPAVAVTKPASHPEFYHAVSSAALMGVLRDPSLKKQYREATQALLFILTSLGGSKASDELAQVLPLLAGAVDQADEPLRVFLFGQLDALVALVGKGVRPHVDELLNLARRYWRTSDKVTGACVTLVQTIAASIGDEVAHYLPLLLPLAVATFRGDASPGRENTARVLHALEAMARGLDGFLYMVVPALLDLVESQDTALPLDVRKDALLRLGSLCDRHDVSSLASLLVHRLVRVLCKERELRTEAMAALYGLAYQLGPDYLSLEPTVRAAMRRSGAKDAAYLLIVEAYERLLLMLMQGDDVKADPSLTPAAVVTRAREGLRATQRLSSDDARAVPVVEVADAAAEEGGTTAAGTLGKRFGMDATKLANAWEARYRLSAEDWEAWMRALALEMLRETPAPALRCCSALAERSLSLSLSLFDAAFFSCWDELLSRGDAGAAARQSLVESVGKAMDSHQMPPQLLQRLLNLNEFLERNGRPLGISWKRLGGLAHRCRAYAKALHYLEAEFDERGVSSQTIEALLQINAQLGQREAAKGILEHARRHHPSCFKESWYEHLNDWTQALKLYEQQAADHEAVSPSESGTQAKEGCALEGLRGSAGPMEGRAFGLELGRMRCHHALAEWGPLAELADRSWGRAHAHEDAPTVELEYLHEVARHGAASAWNLAALAPSAALAAPHWDGLRSFTAAMRHDTVEQSMSLAVLALNDGALQPCQLHIDRARSLLDAELTALVSESYSRAYRMMVTLQQLAELEEVLLLRRAPQQTSLPHLLGIWQQRLHSCERNVEVWQELLSVHSLAAPPRANLETQLHFAELCRASNRQPLAAATLHACGGLTYGADSDAQASIGLTIGAAARNLPPQLALAKAQHEWDTGERGKALLQMRSFVEAHGAPVAPGIAETRDAAQLALAAAGWTRLGEWERTHQRDLRWQRTGGSDDQGNGGGGGDGDGGGFAQAQFAGTPPPPGARETGAEAKAEEKLSRREEARLSQEEEGRMAQRFGAATSLEPRSYLAWHALAMVHFEAAQRDEEEREGRSDDQQARQGCGAGVADDKKKVGSTEDRGRGGAAEGAEADAALERHVCAAIGAFFRSISLAPRSVEATHGAATTTRDSLQDILRLLTLWFRYGMRPAVDAAIRRGLEDDATTGASAVALETWLEVTPQIIARMHSPHQRIRSAVLRLLARMAQAHPQGLIYPLAVAAKSQIALQQVGATQVLRQMRRGADSLVQQAEMVSDELVRTSVLWAETWQAALEEASRVYFGAEGHANTANNATPGSQAQAQAHHEGARAMWALLQPLHLELQRGPQTMSEVSFAQAYGRPLHEAHEWMRRYMRTGEATDVSAAWDLYYKVFRRISKQVVQLSKLDLATVSPKLLSARDLDLAVPGTYRPGRPVVRIHSFKRELTVITSKQRPRKISLVGDDGLAYHFLLKGHEDLRQDERVMQLFGLVNTLLANTAHETGRSNLSVHRYSVVPLSPSSGLISWVDGCDTLHALVQDYRTPRGIPLKVEQRLVAQLSPSSGYDTLPLLQKVEVFKQALQRTAGKDLAQVLWLRSSSAEHWLERRTTYTRSLATMSMVGYVLGLGDRHMSNLMLEQFSGKVLHIDFGDCFEVAIHRAKCPEKVPFRLTRMLVNAMGVSGVEGDFRCTAEGVMGALRRHKDSVLAMLEAFLHDPLISWNLQAKADVEGLGAHKGSGSDERAEAETPLQEQSASHLKRLHLEGHANASALGSLPNREIESCSGRHSDTASDASEAQDERSRGLQAGGVVRRIRAKLFGTDFEQAKGSAPLDTPTQVSRLIAEAQSHENLCQMYHGWNPAW